MAFVPDQELVEAVAAQRADGRSHMALVVGGRGGVTGTGTAPDSLTEDGFLFNERQVVDVTPQMRTGR